MLSVCTVATAVLVATCAASPGDHPTAAAPDRSAALYARHCAVCHGDDGGAETAVAELLRPRPSPFRHGLFKLVGTQNGVPSEADLVAMLRRGMPGSVMMSFGWMPDDDLLAMARHVRSLAIAGRASSIRRAAEVGGRQLDADAATEEAMRLFTPGPAIDVGTPPPVTGDTLALGQQLYERHCGGCHGKDGRGLPVTAEWPTDGTWLWPRDFTAGWLRGGADHGSLMQRVRGGMPGAHMPPTDLAPAEAAALVTYVRGLIADDAADHHVQWRRTLRAQRLPKLPTDGDDAALQRLDAVRLPTVPLWWRLGAIDEVHLAAAHDGDELLLHLSWADATRDDRVRPGSPLGDGVAVQFTAAAEPPLFAMGSGREPVNVWRWHSYDGKETAGMLDLAPDLHHGLDVAARRAPRPRAESIRLTGPGSAAAVTAGGLPLAARATWRDGRWTVTLRRRLAARSGDEVDLVQTPRVHFAIALWDGRVDTHAASKSITTWHVLELAR